MSRPNDDQYRAWSEGNDQTRAFDGYGAQNYPQNAGYGYGEPAPQGGGYYEQDGGRDYAPGYSERSQKQRRAASLTELFNLKSLWIELFIVAIVAGVLYGMIVWVFDLLAVRFSDAVSGEYLALGDPFEYTIRGVGLGILVLVAGAVMMGLHAAVNQPAQLFNLLFVVVGLWALILLLTMALWQSIPEVILLLIGAAIIWGVIPMRVGAYRTGVPRLR
ncbi:hypothetical protein [Dietzia timorensis]|uniref:Uncharacterized protein n=1 Tax=Dietzia timorensis TaxID=499555 RepID=A0A173LNU9_9ACTN|nr:hypothetical protein [Dietzia timorensis]ANI93334.1 Hypothetical protein BJL86_2574 [Dietzia timorensis]